MSLLHAIKGLRLNLQGPYQPIEINELLVVSET